MYLIIGASSFIGRYLYDYCRKMNIKVFGTYHQNSYDKNWIKFDLGQDDLNAFIHMHLSDEKPEVIIICSANTSIDQCKNYEAESYQLNVLNTQRLIAQAQSMKIKIVFLSSESVFDGYKGLYDESDLPNPVTIYGKQKLQVEEYIMQNIQEYLIFRISRAVGSSFGEKDVFGEFYNKIKQNEFILCLKNQHFCLTEVSDLVYAIIQAVQNKLNGLFHLSSTNYISRFQLATMYANKIFGGYENIAEKEYDELPFSDHRQILGGLRGDRLNQLLGLHFLDIEEILEKYQQSYEKYVG